MAAGLMPPEIGEKGAAITKALMEGGAAGWSTLVGINISYVLGPSDYGRPAEIVKPDDVGEVVMTPVDWSGDNTGKVFLLVASAGAKELVAYMMALMLGGDPNPDTTQLDADGMDAYSESVNSFVGQGAQQARGEIGGTIKTSTGASKAGDFTKEEPGAVLGTEDFYSCRVTVTIEGRPPFNLLMLIGRSVTGVEEVATSSNTSAMQTEATAEKLGIDPANLSIAMKVRLPFIVTIASKKMRMELIQDMTPGTIIEFKKMSGEALDVLATNVKIATAEAVIINQCFGVQIRSIVDPRTLQKD